MSAKGCPGLIVEFNTYSISGNDLILLNSFFQGESQSRGPPKLHLAAEGCPGFIMKFNINWQAMAAQDLLWNFISCLPLSCRECLKAEINLTIFGSHRLPRICCEIFYLQLSMSLTPVLQRRPQMVAGLFHVQSV